MADTSRIARFTDEDALRPRFRPQDRTTALRLLGGLGALFIVVAVALGLITAKVGGALAVAAGVALVLAALAGCTFLAGAFVLVFAAPLGRLLLRAALPIFFLAIIGIIVIGWAPALLYDLLDGYSARHGGTELPVAELAATLAGGQANALTTVAAYALWPLQLQLTRDVLAAVGVIGFVSLFAAFAIWWERKVAGHMQSRLGPMRVGGWHGWAQSMADGLKLVQKEDIFLEGADRALFKLAPYLAFIPAMVLFLVMPFGAGWVARDLDAGLIIILALVGIGVVGVLLGGWASNNKWSMLGAMREACQMISYEIPLGFSLLIPIMTVGSLRLSAIGAAQAGGLHTWLIFENPFCFAAALVFFVATLASCKRAPFDLPEAESELVAGYMTEYSGFRWALFMFAEYAEMFAVGILGSLLFLGAWSSPLPASWGAAWEHGTVWQQALYGLLFGSPLWLIAKGFIFVYVQIWLRWTLPRIRLDQVMYACVQVLLPITMLLLLGNTFWLLWVPAGGILDLAVSVALAALGVLFVVSMVAVVLYGFRNAKQLVGTQYVDALPGA